MIRLYLDDVRPCPDGWILARTIEQAQDLLRAGVDEASLDHDLGACAQCKARDGWAQTCAHMRTGLDLVRWMGRTKCWPRAKPVVHSQNPAGAERMRAMIDREFPRASNG